MEFVIVKFPDRRDVFVDDGIVPVATTNRMFELEEGTHKFTLGLPNDYQPTIQIVGVTGTIEANPMSIVFTRTE